MDAWLTTELDRIWLIGELAWRDAQATGRRALPSAPAVADLELVLAQRRARRGATEISSDELAAAVQQAQDGIGPARFGSPLADIALRLGLRLWEIETLVLAMAPHVDPMLHDLFAALRASDPRRGIDVALIGELFGATRADRVALLDVLDARRPLLRWGLVELRGDAAPPVHRELQPSFDVVGLLCGLDARPRHVTIERATATFDDLALAPELRARLGALGAALRNTPRPPWIVAWGRKGAGKATISARLAAHLDRPLVRYTPPRDEAPQLAERLRAAQREALVRDAVLYVGPLVPSPELDETVRRLADHPGALVLGVETTTAPRIANAPALEEIALAIPDESLQRELWSRRIADDARDPWQPAVARTYKLTPGEIAAVADEVGARASSHGRAAGRADVRDAIERRLRSELADMAWRVDVTATWDDVILPPADLVRVRELIARSVHADRVYREWRVARTVSYGAGTVALFSGPPGTGKSMLAGLIAQTLDMALYQVDLSQIVSKWIGETEKQLAKLFDLAERTQAVLLFDEADSLLGKRTEIASSNDRFANTAVNFLLQRLDRYRGIAVLTTNKASALDDALVRRLALHLRLEIPEAPDRLRLWRTFLSPRIPGVDTLDLAWIAEAFELAGGHIKNAAVRAAFLAAAAHAPLDMSLLIDAVEAELDDIGRVVHANTFDRDDVLPDVVAY